MARKVIWTESAWKDLEEVAALNYAAELVESESGLLNEEEANFDGIVKRSFP